MSRRASRWLVVGAGVLAVAGWLSVRGIGSKSAERADWVAVERGELVVGVDVTGTLRAVDSGTLTAPRIKDIHEYKISQMTPEGRQVKAGTPVLGFDTSDLAQKLREFMAEADEARKKIDKTRQELELDRRKDELRLEEARARQRKAQLKVEVPEELQKGQELAVARLDLELANEEIAYLERRMEAARRSAEAALASLESQYRTAERRVQEIRDAIEQMSIVAPRDGTVVYATSWRDEKKKIGDSCWNGEPVMELPDLRRMMAKGQVDEADASRVAEGQPVRLRLDAHPDVEFRGRIASIWKTVQRESWRTPKKVVRLDIELDETDTLRMRPGMRFRGEAEIERIEDVLLIPLEAVFPTADGPVVYRRTLLGVEPVEVELGRRNDERVEVLGGLREGERVSRRELS